MSPGLAMASAEAANVHERRLSKRFRILVISDDAFVQRAIEHDILPCEQFVICGRASTKTEGLEKTVELQPDMVLLNLSLVNGLGLAYVRELKEKCAQARLVVLTAHQDVFYAGQILAAGAQSYLDKGGDRGSFVEALTATARGEMRVPEGIAQHFLYRAAGRQNGHHVSITSTLTAREFQVFELLGQGFNTKRIAAHMGISTHTVETYRERIRLKTSAKDGADLTFRAIVWALLNR